MGRYDWSSKYAIEDCKSISIFWLKKQGYLKKDLAYTNATMKWTSNSGEGRGSIGFSICANVGGGRLMLQYTYTNQPNGEKGDLNYSVDLIPTTCNYGGRRWWFICTASKNGVYCGRRVAKLYLAPNGSCFACRHCYDLTYQSCKDSHKCNSLYADIARRLDISPKSVERLFKQKAY